jgi:hypothetical protein
VRLGIALTLGCKHASTKKIISATAIRWGVKVLPENIVICPRLDPTAPKTPTGHRSFPPISIITVLIHVGRRSVAHKLLYK